MLQTIFGSPARRASSESYFSRVINLSEWQGAKTNSGVNVNQQTALTYAAVWCATRVLCEPAGAMPLETYRRVENDDREIAGDYSLYDVIKSSPNDDMDSQPFWEGRFQHAINWDGGGFAEIEREKNNPDSPVVALHPIHPSRVTRATKDQEDKGFYYNVRSNDGTSMPLHRWEVFHMPGVLSEDGIWSRGVIPYARQTIGFGIATEQYGSTFFGSGGMPRGLVTGFQPYRDPIARKTFRDEFKEAHGSPTSSDVALAPPGVDFKIMSIPNEAAQFLGTRVHNDRVIARWYKVPLHMILDMEKSNYNSIEHMSMEFILHHLWPWLRRCQGQCNLKLIPRRDRGKYYVDYNLSSLLRGDLKSRIESYRVAIMIGTMTINEARKLENMPSIGPAGDVHYIPSNMTTAEVMWKNPPQPEMGASGPGSDQSGVSLNGDDLTRRLTHSDRNEVVQNLKEMERQDDGHDNGNGAYEDARFRTAARAVLVQAYGRIHTKEANAAKRGAARDNFEVWSSEFYSKHRGTFTEELQPATGLLNAIGITATADSLAERLIADSKERITAALNASPATLMAALDSWPTQRAELAADQILGAE